MPEIEIELPHSYQKQEGLIDVKHEEDAIVWLWAYPELMQWQHDIRWLYTPVTGKKKYPGDLWGLDSEGNLLIIECKLCKRNDNPFIDFCDYSYSEGLNANKWKEKFQKHYKAEVSEQFKNGLQKRPPGKTDGILPRSNHRNHIRRWKDLAKKIDDQIRPPGDYQEKILSYLNRRAENKNRKEFYFALMVSSKSNSKILTENSISSGRDLIKKCRSSDFVKVISIKGLILPDKRLKIITEDDSVLINQL